MYIYIVHNYLINVIFLVFNNEKITRKHMNLNN